LRSVLAPLGLDFDPSQLAWAEQVKHIVAGNQIRWEAKSELALDEKWRQRLSATQQRVIDFATLRSRRLLAGTGYFDDQFRKPQCRIRRRLSPPSS
jgi:hypothetical protein